MRNFILVAALVAALLLGGLESRTGAEKTAGKLADGGKCLLCHEDLWLDALQKQYIHKPFAAGDCKYCHAALKGAKDAVSASYLKKAEWVARSSGPAKRHWLEFSEGKRGATLVVEARWQGGQDVREMQLPPFDELAEYSDLGTQPLGISNVRVLEVSRGIFLSATVGWETNQPADSQVEYGVSGLNRKSILDSRLTRNHAVTLVGVESGKQYNYRVISRDLGGQKAASPIKTMLMQVTPPQKSLPENAAGSATGGTQYSVKLYRRDTHCLVVVAAEREMFVRIGLLPKKYGENLAENGLTVVRHVLLTNEQETSTGVCYSCHSEYRKILTHPLNVYPKPGMIIPPEYAMLSDGRMSCMSCHATHAANNEFRLVKADKRELCRGCHRDML